MDTRRPTLAVIFHNGHASQSADRLEEDNYVNTTGRTVNKPSEKKSSCLNHLLVLAVSWGILLLIMVPRIYLTNVLAENIAWLTMENKQLDEDNRYLKEQITDRKQSSVARAQAIVDAYCSGRERRCNPCEDGWQFQGSRCHQWSYLTYPRKDSKKTWEEAREECRRSDSDLLQFDDPYISRKILRLRQGSVWTDLKVENGQWKRANGSYLHDHYSVGPPLDGLCMTVNGFASWEPRDCSDTEEWICVKQALSL